MAEAGKQRDEPVVAAAADHGAGRLPAGEHLEHEAGVVVEPPAEIGGERQPVEGDAARCKRGEAGLEAVERRVDGEPLVAGERAERREVRLRILGQERPAVRVSRDPIKEHIVVPDIDSDKAESMLGMDIIVCTTAKTDDEARALLRAFNFPFRQ